VLALPPLIFYASTLESLPLWASGSWLALAALAEGGRRLERADWLEAAVGVARFGLEALRWGLPVLYDVVATYCG